MKIILATDNDAPGEALAEELSRRLGKERCWRVRWPQRRVDASPDRSVKISSPDAESSEQEGGSDPHMTAPTIQAEVTGTPDGVTLKSDDDGFRKDANEVLVKDGVQRLRELIDAAEPTPINGLFRFRCVLLE